MDLEVYCDHIKRLAIERRGVAVYNGSADHATIIVENMFSAARKCVRILSGDLNAKVYGTEAVVQRARQFLGHSDHRLTILLEHLTISASHPLIEEIGDDANVEILHIPKDLSDRISFHLMTADDDCYRFENEKNSHTAVAGFGDSDTTRHLNDLFGTIYKSCRKLDNSDWHA